MKYAILYLGASEIFPENYAKLMRAKVDLKRREEDEARKEEQANEQEEMNEGEAMQEEENEENSEDEDTETVFLK